MLSWELKGGIVLGKELEYKLFVQNQAQLMQILSDEDVAKLAAGNWQETAMKTTYYDTEDCRFSSRHWTLRHRLEGSIGIVCVKTPQKEAHTRGEWQIQAGKPDEKAIISLVEAGAPRELLYLYGEGKIAPVCGAEFLRRHIMLKFPDGSKAELAGDCGILRGKTEECAFCEIELELYEGEKGQMLDLVRLLCDRYALKEQPMSKHARARALK